MMPSPLAALPLSPLRPLLSLLPALGSQSLAKNLIYPLCSALLGERRAGRKRGIGGIEREETEGKREKERETRSERARKVDAASEEERKREREEKKRRIYSCSRFLARAGYALRRSCKTCLLRRIPFLPPATSFFSSALSLFLRRSRAASSLGRRAERRSR